jgi:hypothetical protein
MKIDLTKNGGILNVALDGRLDTTTAPELEKLLSYRESGRLIFFDRDAYPIEYAEEYAKCLASLGEEYGSRYVADTKYVSFTEYALEGGATVLYLLDVNWWEDAAATCTLKLPDFSYPLTLSGNEMRIVYVSPSGKSAALLPMSDVDVECITDTSLTLRGIGEVSVTIFKDGKTEIRSFDVEGKTYVEF